MFGPNCTTLLHQQVDGHHREESFMDAFDLARETFCKKFRLGTEWEVLLLTGSGTLGVEAAIASLRAQARAPVVRGEFTARMAALMDVHGVLDARAPESCGVAIETSLSDWRPEDGRLVLDAVSSFPYYGIPPDTKVWVTVSSKQLGAAPILAIVAVRQDAWPLLHGAERFSYLNLARYREAAQRRQTPHTPAMPLVADFAEKVRAFDLQALRTKVDSNSDRLVKVFEAESVLGARRGPVITVPKTSVPVSLARRFQLYGLHTDSTNYQVFTYSEPQERYEELFEALETATVRTPA